MSSIPLPIANKDADTGAEATVTRGGELVQVSRTRRAGGVLSTTLAPWYADASSGAGSVAVVGAAAEVHSGVAAAPIGRLQSVHRARMIVSQSCHCTVVAAITGGLLTSGGRFRFGAFDDNDGFFIEVLTGPAPVGRIVSRKATVDTVVTPPFGQVQPLIVNSSRHAYTIRYLITVADFLQDGVLRHTITAGAGGAPFPLLSAADLPVRVEAENLAAPGTDFIILAGNASISRLGDDAFADASAITRVATSTASAQLIAANPMRRFVVIHNDSNRELRIKYGATASPTSYTHVLGPDSEIIISGMEWAGRIDGILASGSGNAQVTETTEI